MTVFSTPDRVVIRRTRGVTSWSMSRSTVTIVVSRSSFASSWRVLVPEGRPRKVERDREVLRLEVLDAAQHDAGKPEDAVDELSFRGRQRRQREVAAVDEPVA